MNVSENLEADLSEAWKLAHTGRPDLAFDKALSVKESAERNGKLGMSARASQYCGWFLRQLSRSTEGIGFIQDSRRIFTELGNADEDAKSAAIFAWLLMEFGANELAASEASYAFEHSRTMTDNSSRAFIADVYAIALNQVADFEGALTVNQEALELAREYCEPYELPGYLIDRGFIFTCIASAQRDASNSELEHQFLLQAIGFNEEGTQEAMRNGDSWTWRIGLSNSADLYAKLGNFEAAWSCLREWDKVPGHAEARLSREYNYAKCQILIAEGHNDEALEFCKLAVDASIAIGVPHQEVEAIKTLSHLYEIRNDTKNALRYFKLYHNFIRNNFNNVKKNFRIFFDLSQEISALRDNVLFEQRKNQELQTQASQDPLTGLPNRREFEKELMSLDDRERIYHLAVIDVDNFKRVNDRYSHSVGDEVLKVVAEKLMINTNTEIKAFRIGGEEFALVIKQMNKNKAISVCEKIRREIRNYHWSTMGMGMRVTISVGLCDAQREASTREILNEADRRLYRAKRSGKNRVISDTPDLLGATVFS